MDGLPEDAGVEHDGVVVTEGAGDMGQLGAREAGGAAAVHHVERLAQAEFTSRIGKDLVARYKEVDRQDRRDLAVFKNLECGPESRGPEQTFPARVRARRPLDCFRPEEEE